MAHFQNFIKKISPLFLTALFIALTSASAPDKRKPVTPTKSDRIVLTHARDKEADRPQVPSKQRISCAYDGEYLILGFVVPEGECEVTLTEWYTNAEQTYVIDSTPLSAEIYVGELYESTLTISTEKGNTYTAELSADPDDE